ncbi:MAG: LD-carboxypeptidase [Proteobacteria bacterium]|nr:LD-carboxypeptidase [Pseudomonadota bacterium]
MTRQCPPALSPGDRIGVVSPAGPVKPKELEAGISRLARRYTPVWDTGGLCPEGYLAGSDEQRLVELQSAIQDPEIKAVLAARGGFGTTRILDRLELSYLEEEPKWLVGSSDLTALLVQLWVKHGVVAIHGPMVFRFEKANEDDLDLLFDLLEGRPWTPPKELKPLFTGQAHGPIIGGNLTVLAHLVGTVPRDFAQGAILFLEDICEQPYRLDRCLTQLRRSGVLDGISGVVLGEFVNCEPGLDGIRVTQVMEKNLKPLGVPVATGYPAAHGKRNHPFVHGADIWLEVDEKSAAIRIT